MTGDWATGAGNATIVRVALAVKGDLNCDGSVNFGDISPSVLAPSNPAVWQQTYPGCPLLNGDINGNGTCRFDDINPFVALLTGR